MAEHLVKNKNKRPWAVFDLVDASGNGFLSTFEFDGETKLMNNAQDMVTSNRVELDNHLANLVEERFCTESPA